MKCFGIGEIGERFVKIAKEREIHISVTMMPRNGGTDFWGIPVDSLARLLEIKEELVFFVTDLRYKMEISLQLKGNPSKKCIYIEKNCPLKKVSVLTKVPWW